MRKNFLAIKKFSALVLFLIFVLASCCEAGANPEELLKSLSLREKVGQLFLIRPDALDINLTLDEINDTKAAGTKAFTSNMLVTLKEYPAGGFALFKKNISDPEQLKTFTRDLNQASGGRIIPIIAVDEEGGKISRIANAKNFKVKKFKSPEEIAKQGQAREAGAVIGKYLREYGFNFDFAPVADVNTNPENIVIGDRALGSDVKTVAKNVSEFLEGLHSQGVAGCIKHFPGHGDTKLDTHKGTVEIYKTWEQLLKLEIIPFKENFSKTDAIMTAHISLEKIDDVPATLSHELLTNKLRKELGYDGVIVTDAMSMEAITEKYSSGEAAVLAVEAGIDLILLPYDYREAFEGILSAVKSGRLSEKRIDESVKRILKLKEGIKTMQNLKWWQARPLYQVYPKSFLDTDGNGIGNIKGITEKLDYLKDLDIASIWITPVYPSPMFDNGYDISNYTDINPLFGSMKDFDELVSEAAKRDIKIIMDLVFNHTSDQHPWFLESKSSRDNPKADWYIWRDPKPNGQAPTNWRAIFGGSAWTWNEERQQYYLHTFAVQQPDLNWENPEVRKALYDAANFWISKGVGGFRVDAIPYIKKPAEFLDGQPDAKDGTVNIHTMTVNQPGILNFLREFKRKIREGHDIFTVGEANGVKPEELGDWVGDRGVFDMLIEFSHVNLSFEGIETWCYTKDWKLTDLKRVLTASQNATRSSWYPVFFENHDQPRSVNHFFPASFDSKKAAKALATVLMTLRGTPFIYQGQELGMSNVSWNNIKDYDDISSRGQYDLAIEEGFTHDEAMNFVRYFSRDNARTPIQWNNKANAGFSSGTPWLPVNVNYKEINAEAEEKDPDSVLNFYKKLSALRKDYRALIAGDYREIYPDSEEVFAYERSLSNEKITTLVNFTDKPVKIPAELAVKKIIFSSEAEPKISELAPLEGRLYED